MRAEIIHIWAATAGEPPTSPAGHTPLSADTYDGAVNELADLQKPVPADAPHLYRLIANMASRIRPDEVTLYYQLIATMESTWRPLDSSTDLSKIRTTARQEVLSSPDLRVVGDHPGTSHAYNPDIDVKGDEVRIAVRTGQDPNSDDRSIWDMRVPAEITTDDLTQVVEEVREILAEINHPDAPTPDEPITIWHTYRIIATTGWIHSDDDVPTQKILDAVSQNLNSK